MDIEFKVAGKTFKTQNEANEYIDKTNNTKHAYVVITNTPVLNEYGDWKMTKVDIAPLSYYNKELYLLPDLFVKFANMVWNKYYTKYDNVDKTGSLVENYSKPYVCFGDLSDIKKKYSGFFTFCNFNVRREFDLSNLSYDYDETFMAIEMYYLEEPNDFPSPFLDFD